MRTMHTSIGAKVIALTLALGWQAMTIGHAIALTSTSFQIRDTFGSYETNGIGDSPSYEQGEGEGGVTWYNGELSSPSYSIITSIDTSSTSSSSSSSGGSSGGSTGGTSGGSGGSTSGGGNGGGYYPPLSSSSSAGAEQISSSQRPVRSSRSSSASSTSTHSSIAPLASSAPALEDKVEGMSNFHEAAGWQIDPMAQVDEVEGRFATAMHFFCNTQLLDPAQMYTSWLPWLLIAASIILTAINILLILKKETPKSAKPTRKKKSRVTSGMRRTVLLAVLGIVCALFALLIPLSASAIGTTPMLRSYNGTLLDASGNPVTTAVSVRFSYWKSSDYLSTDTSATGAINTGSVNYVGWQEVQTTTPSAKGSFSLNFGEFSPLVNFQSLAPSTLKNLHLQVEVKAAGDPDTAFELLDVNSASSTIDRSQITSVPFARNADLLDQRDTGTGSGDIAVLEFGGLLPISTIPGGTNLGTFTLDSDNSETSEIALTFGAALEKKLTYDISDGTFRFNDDVEIQGNLTVTGLVNGVNITSLQNSTDALKAFSGGGLNLSVSMGSYRLNGVATNYAGGTIALPSSATNSVFFGSGGLTYAAAFPTDESFIPVATVTTSAGSIVTVLDRRTLSSDDREHTSAVTFNPGFEKASYQADGADNVGQLSVSHDNISLKNFYVWTSTKSSLQDYDIILRVPVPEHFVRWNVSGAANPISLMYRSTSAAAADNKLDIQIYDTNGVPVSLSGSVSNLAGTSWATSEIEFTGSPTWTVGQDMLLRLKLSAKDAYQMHIGSLKLNFVELE